jgi:hypothetical protein
VPTPPGFASVSYQLTQTGLTRNAYLTFGVDPTATDPAAVAVSVQAAYNDPGSLNSVMDSTVSLTATRVSLGTDGSADLVYVLSASIAGGGGSLASPPPNCAVLVKKSTDLGGRRGRGRMYIPWCLLGTNISEAGVIAAGSITTIQNAVNAWRTALTTRAVPLVLLHRPGKSAIQPPSPVTNLAVDNRVATQRRRVGR